MTTTIVLLNEPVRLTGTGIQDLLQMRADTFAGNLHTEIRPEIGIGRNYVDERAAFSQLLPMLQIRYFGEHVIIKDGAVADHDRSRRDLLKRFFREERKGGSVYIGFVGPQRVARVPTPLLRRP